MDEDGGLVGSSYSEPRLHELPVGPPREAAMKWYAD